MAIWQFQLALAPPVASEPPGADDETGWEDHQPPAGFEAVIDTFTPRAASWSDAMLMWGAESGDRVQVWFDGGRVVSIVCRHDLRAFSEPFARGVLGLAAFCGCRLRDRAGRVFPAQWLALIAAIRASEELRFVRDPHGFLAGLSGRPPIGLITSSAAEGVRIAEADDRQPFSMVQEACDSYEARVLPDGRTEVHIVVPPRFADLWLVKLSELRGTLAELRSLAGSAPDVEQNAAADGGS